MPARRLLRSGRLGSGSRDDGAWGRHRRASLGGGVYWLGSLVSCAGKGLGDEGNMEIVERREQEMRRYILERRGTKAVETDILAGVNDGEFTGEG